MKCKLTGDDGNGVRAHIIPRSFYNLDYSEPVPLKIITNSVNGYNGRSFVGIYDSSIVTEQGERVFSPWDRYAHQLLVTDRNKFSALRSGKEIVGLQTPDYDYTKLKLFFLSVLWRASVSRQPFFRKVDLGAHEMVVRDALLVSNPGNPEFFAVTLGCFVDVPPDHTAMLDPFSEKYDGVNYYRFFFGSYVAYIKVDQRRAPQLLAPTVLRPNSPLTIVAREFHKSKEKVVLRKLVIEHGG